MLIMVFILFLPGYLIAGYHALIIGNNEYQNMDKLKTAVNDAREVEKLLAGQYGFKTNLLLNASRRDILKALNRFRRQLKSEDSLLIYYAGHGWLDREADLGYWLPVDAEKGDSTNWIPNATITGTIRAIPARHILLVADSCYSGSLSRGVDVGIRPQDYFDKLARKKSRTVLTSGGLEPVMDSGGGKNSVFARQFINALKGNQDKIDGQYLFSRLRRPVMLISDQTPVYSDIRKSGHEMGGDFVFVPEGSVQPETDMVLIPAGAFEMGSNDGDKDEKPVHTVTLDAFYMDKHEVTVAQYKRCVASGQCEVANSNYWSGKHQSEYDKYCNYDKTDRGNHPLNCVDWKNASAYCQYVGKQLPTEAQWEKAATWKDGRKYKYPSGKTSVSCADAVLDDGGWGCGKNRTWPAGSKPVEINGTYDMAGNVWEWISDWYGSYSGSEQRNPQGPASGSGRVFRGGSWSGTASNLRGAIRGSSDPSSRFYNLGFRCVGSP